MMTFDLFWSRYPRKVAKAVARKSWLKLSPEQIEKALSAVEAHCAYWRATGTAWNFIPLPATWINQERWEDVLEMPALERVVAWWATDSGVLGKGRELGIQPRPGEEMPAFKQRVVDGMRRSA